MSKKASILVIDDDVSVRAVISGALSDAGYEVLEAADGKEGLESYKNSPTELVITDLVMPEKEGIETIVELCRDFPAVKIIAISGGSKYGDESNLLIAKTLGAKRAISKPFKIADLLEAVRDVLETN